MLQGVPPEQRKAMQTTAFLNPIMTFVFCMMYNAGLGLYFGAGGIILIIQQAIVTYVVTPNIRKRMDAEMEENPPVIVVDEHTLITGIRQLLVPLVQLVQQVAANLLIPTPLIIIANYVGVTLVNNSVPGNNRQVMNSPDRKACD